jgi:hypothetical protein
MDVPNPEDQADRVKDALFRANKLEAIKLYREKTGVGLAEAKQAVESLERHLRASSPERSSGPAPSGCAVTTGVLVALAGLLAALVLRG